MQAHAAVALPLVLALEPVAGTAPARPTLTRDEASALAAHVADDLVRLLPDLAHTRLALAGALFDLVELLRPGFPVWSTLEELARRLPQAQLAQVVAFGSRDGRMPVQPLQPDPAFAQGPLRLLPIVLLAPAALADTLRQTLETELVGRGEAGTVCADALMRLFDVRLEHARYLTRDDLLALACVQYEHVNLAPLWTLLETALLDPSTGVTTQSARGLELALTAGTVRVSSPARWLEGQHGDGAQRRHAFAGAIFELRQYAALLEAHGLALALDGGSPAPAGLLLERFPAPTTAAPSRAYAHTAPGLGIVAVSVAQDTAETNRPHPLAHLYPLAPAALGELRALLAAQFGIEAWDSGPIALTDQGRLGVPGAALH